MPGKIPQGALAVLGDIGKAKLDTAAGGLMAKLLGPVGRTVAGRAGLTLAALGGNLVRGLLVWWEPADGRFRTFRFQMNPDSFKETVTPKYATQEVVGQPRPQLQWINGGPREMTLTLTFWNLERDRSKIVEYVQQLRSLTERRGNPNPAPGTPPQADGMGAPPAVRFFAGRLYTGERWVVTRFEVEYKDLFDPLTLYPLRAVVSLTLTEAPDPTQSHTPATPTFKQGLGSYQSMVGLR